MGSEMCIRDSIHIPRNVNIAQINYLNTGDWTENCSAIVESENGHMSLIDWRNNYLAFVESSSSNDSVMHHQDSS